MDADGPDNVEAASLNTAEAGSEQEKEESAPSAENVSEVTTSQDTPISEETRKTQEESSEAPEDLKRKREDTGDTATENEEAKKARAEEPAVLDSVVPEETKDDSRATEETKPGEAKPEETVNGAPTNPDPAPANPDPAPVPPSKEGLSFFGDNDVLSGRGGGTNVHPGNRNFRDLINLHRRNYLKARKNDKPAISRAIVRTVREANGRFLKKDEKSGLWFEVGDDAAREKTSQALRQRAPEMRKLLFDTEREEARVAAEEHMRQQRMLMGGMGMTPDMMPNGMPGMMQPNGNPAMMMNPAAMMNPAMLAVMAQQNNKNGMPTMPNMQSGGPPGHNPYQQMFNATLMGQQHNQQHGLPQGQQQGQQGQQQVQQHTQQQHVQQLAQQQGIQQDNPGAPSSVPTNQSEV